MVTAALMLSPCARRSHVLTIACFASGQRRRSAPTLTATTTDGARPPRTGRGEPMSAQIDNLMMDAPLTLTHFFERSARLFARKTLATRVPGRPLFRYTYADFAERTRRLAGVLWTLGITYGGRWATLDLTGIRIFERYWPFSSSS